ncbi:Retrovirus-related Pol polyprotein from transposon TNT 1-94 [Vitis vinifera]|uniref:Retrovirus-related Pol polyprotein from transposon TNT 1-94 n=1 Tax=Vitis vinifera TaxID=29760 RepID=A0A438G7W0_VITVI|nr:Retrovirus-related Pol polyprotein from transposon TNT 1-94 [Vitis vinifera]
MVVNVYESKNYERLLTLTHRLRNVECITKAFYDGSDELQVFTLNKKTFTAKQSGRSLSEYYGELTEIFCKLDHRDKVVMKDLEDIAAYRKSIERQWVHIFLVGLDGDFEQRSTQNWRDQSKTNHSQTDPNIDKSTFKCTHYNKTSHTKSCCFEIVGYPNWWDHNRDQQKKDSKKTSTAAVTEIKIEANVVEKASVLVAATDYGDRSHPLDLPHKKLFPQPMDIQTRQTIGCGIKQGKLYYLDLQSKDSNKLRQALMADGSEGEKKKMTWLCLMKTKDEVNLLFQKFHKMIETQYNAKGEAITSAAYLINRVSSSSINFQTPLQVLTNAVVAPTVPNLPLRVFGCVAFVHLHKHQCTKLTSRVLQCVFVGYALHKKGYDVTILQLDERLL